MDSTPLKANARAPRPAPAWIWGPAGRDTQLARAISDLTVGEFLGSTRELLSCARDADQHDRRAYCTSVLAAVIVRRRLSCDERWLADEPESPDALLLHARVLAVRAIHASRARAKYAAEMAAQAAEACRDAARAASADPTPWVALLSLGECGPHLPELRPSAPAPDGLPVLGPWGVLAEILERAPFSREAIHRLIPCCRAAPPAAATGTPIAEAVGSTDAQDAAARALVAVWAADRAPSGSPLKLLRLMHSPERDPSPDPAEEIRLTNYLGSNGQSSREEYLRDRIPAIEERWRLALRVGAANLSAAWFAGGAEPPYMPLSDISFLAHYLYRVGEHRAARLALEWMIPHATVEPWQHEGDPAEVLAEVCRECRIPPDRLPC
ncbi:MAG TPA: hypothetical protein VH372_24525 [Actinospica sp.]|jgi:hypothetical protein|nr:hypothetical protein [Actinospica sp.]